MGTGTVATAVLFSGAFPAMFGTFVKYQFQHTYDAILAAPVDTEELVTAEALWIAARAGVYGCVPMLVAMVFGLDPSWGMLPVPFIASLAGFGWAWFGISSPAKAKSIENFSYWQSGLLTPLFLVAGTFFPMTGCREWAQVLGNLNPLYHCVQLVRHAAFGFAGWADVGHLGVPDRFRARVVAARDPVHGAQADPLAGGSLPAGGAQQILVARQLHARPAALLARLHLLLVDPAPAFPVDRLGAAFLEQLQDVVVARRLVEHAGLGVRQYAARRLLAVLLVGADNAVRAAADPARHVVAGHVMLAVDHPARDIRDCRRARRTATPGSRSR